MEDTYVIFEAFPELSGKEIEKIEYRSRDNLVREDISVEELMFSVRTSNALHRANIKMISEIVWLTLDEFSEIRNLGAKSRQEIIDYLTKNAIVYCKGDKIDGFADQLYKEIIALIRESRPDYDESSIERALKIAITDNKEQLIQRIGDGEQGFDKGLICDAIKSIIAKSQCMQDVFSSIILSVFSDTQEIVLLSRFYEEIPEIFIYDGMINKCLANLEEDKKVEYLNNGYRLRLPYLNEWIDSLNEKQKLIISMRIQPKTLEECGQELGVTRERIRQIESKALKSKPQLREDDYAYWYMKYDMNADAMNWIFGVENNVYQYLKLAYKVGTIDVEDMIDDSEMNASIYSSYQKYINRNSILIGDEYVKIKRDLICRKLAEQICSEKEISYDEFYDLYLEFLEEHHLNTNPKLLFSSARAFEARLQDSNYILMKYGRRMRYYPIKEYDIEEFVDALHLERYTDVEISTAKILRDNQEIMEEYNIQDEYELHNLLNKTQDVWNADNRYNLEIMRMPFIVFGNADRAKQTVWLLYQIAPVSQEEFGQFYEEEFGVKANTVIANMGKYIYQYYHAGMYRVDQPLLTNEEKEYMLSVAIKDFYFVDELERLFVRQFGKENLSHLNPRTYKELGFRVYAGYLVRDTYASADEYFEKEFTKSDMLDLTNYDARLIYIQISNTVLERLRSNYDLIEYEDKKYISYERFSSVADSITKDTLKAYVEQVLEASGDEKFFTIKSLKRNGFANELHNLGFSDWFNSSLVKNSKKIRYIRTVDSVIFAKTDTQPTLLEFISYVLQKVRKMDIHDFLVYLKEEYGVTLRKDKVTWLIKDSTLYYDSIMEKIYFDKEDYYEDF